MSARPGTATVSEHAEGPAKDAATGPLPPDAQVAISLLAPSLPPDALIRDQVELATYECDGLTQFRARPAFAVLAASGEDIQRVVGVCARLKLPFVARGSGTGLSGGSVPHADGALVVTTRMRRVLELRAEDLRAVLEPGVTNLEVSRAAQPYGLFYAPDPSSQQVCSVGGNVAENSGGAHCLKYGFTTNHVTGIEVVTPDGAVAELGGPAGDVPGYDLVGTFVGSEGTLGVATKVTVRLLPRPEAVQTLLAGFSDIDSAGRAVSAIIAAGLVPAAIEMMDALSISAAEKAVKCEYPEGAGAVLIVELDGPVTEVEEGLTDVERLCSAHGAFEIRIAVDDVERARIWRGRKSAFAAMGRLSPAYIVQDGVVPRSDLPEVLRDIARLSAEAGIRVANVFHAGDGNLHPLVLYDDGVEGEEQRAEELSTEILDLCIARGGSITGEHGVGLHKLTAMAKMFTEDDLDTMLLVRRAFDPEGICNPGKAVPTPRLCGEPPRPRHGAHPLQEQGVAELF
ncbi:MAG TPA: FAD-linked oxidase C-terminal domain-containing protein [Acidimicrobiales bacterium]|nr:FAD-linked oxidase C-terminal domain-containing protein [Acidimicrobiales bacterium]